MSALITMHPDPFQTHPSLFFVSFVAFWCLTIFFIATLSGWLTLAHKFRCENDFAGEKFRFRSAYMRFFSHYGNVLTFGADSSGLYMSIFPIFRPGHPPLLIPWSEISVIPGETGVVFKRRKLLLGREESIPLSISVSLAADLRQAADSSWPEKSLGV